MRTSKPNSNGAHIHKKALEWGIAIRGNATSKIYFFEGGVGKVTTVDKQTERSGTRR